MTVTRLPATACPVCAATLDAHGDTPAHDPRPRPPQAGDFSVCAYCATILVFDDPQTLRRITPAELAAVPRDDELFQIQRFFQRRNAERN